MRRVFRYVFLWFAVLYLAGVVLQVYFAGLTVFHQEGGRDLHVGLGYPLATAGVLFAALPALARAGRTTIILGAVLAVSSLFQPSLAAARNDSPFIAAFHAVNALLIFILAIVMIRAAVPLIRELRPNPEPAGVQSV